MRVQMTGKAVTHVERAPLGLRFAVEMMQCHEINQNMNVLHNVMCDTMTEFVRLSAKVLPRLIPAPSTSFPIYEQSLNQPDFVSLLSRFCHVAPAPVSLYQMISLGGAHTSPTWLLHVCDATTTIAWKGPTILPRGSSTCDATKALAQERPRVCPRGSSTREMLAQHKLRRSPISPAWLLHECDVRPRDRALLRACPISL